MTLDPKLQVGGVKPFETNDPLVVLLYLLMRDHLNAGIFEKLVVEMAEAPRAKLTNPFLAAHADNLAERLRILGEAEAMAAPEQSNSGVPEEAVEILAARDASCGEEGWRRLQREAPKLCENYRRSAHRNLAAALPALHAQRDREWRERLREIRRNAECVPSDQRLVNAVRLVEAALDADGFA